MSSRSRVTCAAFMSLAAASAAQAALVDIQDLFRLNGGTVAVNSRGDSFRTSSSGGLAAQLGQSLNLANVGDFVELRFNIVQNLNGNNQQHTVRFGLFNSNGSPVTADDQTTATDDWLGYFPSLTTRNGGTENANIKEQGVGAGIALNQAGAGVTNLGASAPSGIDQGIINQLMTLRIERTAAGLDVSGGPFQSETAPALQTRSDATPVTTTFDSIAIAFGSGGAIVNDLQVETNVFVASPATPPGLPAGGPFVLIEDFTGETTGVSLNTLPNWTATTGSGGTAIVTVDPNDPLNVVGFVGNRSVNARLSDAALAVNDLQGGTVFFRSQFSLLNDTDTMGFGLGTSSGAVVSGANAVGGGLRVIGTSSPTILLMEGVWYNTWIVADHDADLVSIYLQSDDDPNFLTQTLFKTTAFTGLFPNATTLDRFVFLTGNVPDSPRMFFDDIYFSARGANLANPLLVTNDPGVVPEPATAALVVLGLACFTRRRIRQQ